MSDKEESDRKRILDSVDTKRLFDKTESAIIEWNIDNIVSEANRGKFRECTVDRAPLRTKYFFGEGYTYGGQLQERGVGNEKLFPKGEVDPIPDWVRELVIKPVEESGLVRAGWINSAVINDYLPGGCIVSHIDPVQLFCRPIITVSFFSDSFLSFGCKFSFKPIRVSPPLAQVAVRRGSALSMYGYSANNVTHCIRPEDVRERRAVIILRHVPHTAPRMSDEDMEAFRRQEEDRKKQRRERSRSPARSNVYIYDHRKLGSRGSRRSCSKDNYRFDRFRRRSRSRSPPRYRRRSRSYGQHHHGRRSRSHDRRRRRSGSTDEDRLPNRRSRSGSRGRYRKSRSRSRGRRSRSGRSRSKSGNNQRRSISRSVSRDRFGRTRAIQHVYSQIKDIYKKKDSKLSNLSSRTVDKILERQNEIGGEINNKRTSRSRSREKVQKEIKKKVQVNKSIQNAILKNIMGSHEEKEDKDDESSSCDESVVEAVSNITKNPQLDKDDLAFKDRLQKLRMQVADKAKAGKYGKVILDNNPIDGQNNQKQKGLEKEVEDLRKELKELKEYINDRNQASSTSSESESEAEEQPVNVLDIFKTTILQKSKKSTYVFKDKKKKVFETKTRKILKERIEMLNKK